MDENWIDIPTIMINANNETLNDGGSDVRLYLYSMSSTRILCSDVACYPYFYI